MGANTGIQWTQSTWNPVTGCTKISAGCDNCYAERIAERFRGTPSFINGFDLTLRPERLQQPLKWKKPRMIFVNSMSDLFHKDIPEEFQDNVFDVMEAASQHTFQVLTKRSILMFHYITSRYLRCQLPINIWLGVSVENGGQFSRITHLQQTVAGVRFLSIEPLLGPIEKLPLKGIHWVIVGGESGANARHMNPDWARAIRDQCAAAGVPFFMKQMARKATIPDDLMIREYPTTGTSE